uniref:Notch ligand N-terminal domain-containing protein n=1 Tax=Lates calcarifer TaxID=8187 RepID=A0A4W6CH84_LATCA
MWNNLGKLHRFSLVCLLLTLWAEVSQSTGYFELQLISVDNPKGQLLNGDCCDAEKSAAEGHCGADECDTYFRVCLKEYQTEVTTNGPCIYGSETTKVIGGNTFQFKGGQKTGQNRNNDAGKIIIPFQFAWPVSRSLSLFVEVETVQIYGLWFLKVRCQRAFTFTQMLCLKTNSNKREFGC